MLCSATPPDIELSGSSSTQSLCACHGHSVARHNQDLPGAKAHVESQSGNNETITVLTLGLQVHIKNTYFGAKVYKYDLLWETRSIRVVTYYSPVTVTTWPTLLKELMSGLQLQLWLGYNCPGPPSTAA